jgi:squalene-hopene/tetraprenyl-beta-curcumene cyclase
MNTKVIRMVAIAALGVWPTPAGDWSPRRAADYLDARQKQWFEWPPAKSVGGPCVSCHTGVTYLLARPALRRALGENQPTPYETGLTDALRARIDRTLADLLKTRKEPLASQEIGVEAVFSALFLNIEKPAPPQSSSFAQRALERLWSLQIQDGKAKGAWGWFEFNAAPYEMPGSRFFGASLAAMAVGSTPPDYRGREEIKLRIAELAAYFDRERQTQPLHSRLMLLWASTQLPEALADPARRAIIDEALRKQQPDGSWTNADLGPWAARPDAPSPTEVDTYATAFTTFTLEQAGVPLSNAKMTRALAWLRSHQDREGGYWPAVSMNKRYEAGSMQARFMQDAATAFAALALLDVDQPAARR